jgi:hypothetical protein
MKGDIPTCEGCSKKGFFLCDDCRTPTHEEQERNHNIQQPDNHNRYNFTEW